MIKVQFYRTDDEKCPVDDFLESLSSKSAQKIAWVLKAIRELNPVPTNYFKKLVNTDDLWEVRASSGNNSYRLLGFFYEDNFIVLTNGFQKKQQKTPKKEIKLAENRKKDYLIRRKKNG